ncbi:hypothetical protein mvi_54100 [Methylobacterium indicum]|uniref:Uncharacterized protein n=1 Tax=Methylobacterium indicum TaxID=1775910 RepID=A0A8H8WZF9_9HYPH|nr:hypothetical protein mvi_54100 [Methylobacterium indicum]
MAGWDTAREDLMTTAPDGSIIQRDAPRPDLLAFEIRDRITKPDIEWMSGSSTRR